MWDPLGPPRERERREELFARSEELEGLADTRCQRDAVEAQRLRHDAAALRLESLSNRPYPVAMCARCLALTGWVNAEQLCDHCLRSQKLREEFRDPHGGFVHLDDHPSDELLDETPRVRRQIAWTRAARASRKRLVASRWLERVDPDKTGPIDPELGFEVEVAHRREGESTDGDTNLVWFTASTHVFEAENGWRRLRATRTSLRTLVAAAEFPVTLPIDQLAEAWGDFQNATYLFNVARWSQESKRRESIREAQQRRAEQRRDQQDVAALLHEDDP